jgi:hypothetical protein
MPNYLFAKKIQDAIVAGIRDCGEQIFKDSQMYVPVDKGQLKKSGRTKKIYNGFQIAYRTPYAAAVEYGYGPMVERVSRHWVREHFRKYRHFRKIVNVKTGRVYTHVLGPPRLYNGVMARRLLPVDIKRKMKNKQLVTAHFRGPFDRRVGRVVGRFYLRTAVDNYLSDLPVFIAAHL